MDGSSTGQMKLVYPDDSELTDQEKIFFSSQEELRIRNADVWQSRNIPLPWLRPGFNMSSVWRENNDRSQAAQASLVEPGESRIFLYGSNHQQWLL